MLIWLRAGDSHRVRLPCSMECSPSQAGKLTSVCIRVRATRSIVPKRALLTEESAVAAIALTFLEGSLDFPVSFQEPFLHIPPTGCAQLNRLGIHQAGAHRTIRTDGYVAYPTPAI